VHSVRGAFTNAGEDEILELSAPTSQQTDMAAIHVKDCTAIVATVSLQHRDAQNIGPPDQNVCLRGVHALRVTDLHPGLPRHRAHWRQLDVFAGCVQRPEGPVLLLRPRQRRAHGDDCPLQLCCTRLRNPTAVQHGDAMPRLRCCTRLFDCSQDGHSMQQRTVNATLACEGVGGLYRGAVGTKSKPHRMHATECNAQMHTREDVGYPADGDPPQLPDSTFTCCLRIRRIS